MSMLDKIISWGLVKFLNVAYLLFGQLKVFCNMSNFILAVEECSVGKRTGTIVIAKLLSDINNLI